MEKEIIKTIDDFDNKTNNEILLEIKQMELDHEALKNKMINDFDKLVEIEKKFQKANNMELNRLKG
jgi:hypothetical protein